jgi:hypothetical protein
MAAQEAQRGGAMMQPWYRSRLFIGGSLLLGLLLWMWVDSVYSRTICTLASREDAVVFALSDGKIYFGLVVDYPNIIEVSGAYGSGVERRSVGTEARQWIVSPLDFRRSPKGEEREWSGMIQIWVGLWAIVLGYVLLWIAIQVIWQRRKRRLLAQQLPAG